MEGWRGDSGVESSGVERGKDEWSRVAESREVEISKWG